MNIKSLTAAISALLLPTALNAAALVTYNFNTNANPLNATTAVTGSAAANGGGLGNFGAGFDTTPAYPSKVLQVNPPSDAVDLASAIPRDSYFTLTLTPNSGNFSLSNVTFDVGRGGGALQRGFTLRSSLTGATNLFQDNFVPAQRPDLTSYDVDLTTFGDFDSISGPVTFDFYIHTPAAGNSLEFDDIVFNGTTIPEPSTALLGMLGGLALLRRKR